MMRKSYRPNKPNTKGKIATPTPNNDFINESIYINAIISNNITDKFKFRFFNFKKLFLAPNKGLIHILRKMNYIYLSKSNYKQLKKINYLNLLLCLALNIIEFKTNIIEIKELLINNYIMLIHKIYSNNNLPINDISILIKFLSYSSIYKRKEIKTDEIKLLQKLTGKKIKYYGTIKFIIEIIKILNVPIVTIEFCEFLNSHFLMEKSNLFLLTEKIDMMELLYLNDQNDFILDFLSKIYSFRSNKSFLALFIEKIKVIYKERRDKDITKENQTEMNNSFMNLLTNLNRSILLIQSLRQNEENKCKEDSYFPEKGFIFNNNKTNGLGVEKIIVQNSVTFVFSFCFSPSQANTEKNEVEYPIIFASSEKDNFYFYIKNDCLYYKTLKANKNLNICNIKKNLTYLCYYSIKEHDNYVIAIKADNFEFQVMDAYRYFLKRNLTMIIGRYEKQNFEGYIGPILIFKEYFEDEYKNYFFSLKGYYDKILYFYEYNSLETDKFDKYTNHILNDGNYTNYSGIKEENIKIIDKKKEKEKSKKSKIKNFFSLGGNEVKVNNRDYFLNLKKKLKENNIINSKLMFYISPLFSNSALKKNSFANYIFAETLIKKLNEGSSTSSTLFYHNKSFIFQFLKYDGMNYLIMVLELIIANNDNIKIESHKKTIIDIFQCILIFINGLLYHINIESYFSEIRAFLFCVKKFVMKFCKLKGLGNEIHLILNNTLQNFDELNKSNFTENKKHYINVIKNEICKILLNADMYDLSNFSLINTFMGNLEIFILNQDNSGGLLNKQLFKKITDFAIIYDKINIKNDKIKNDPQFKSFKKHFLKILLSFVKKSESLEIYTELYNIFSNDLKFNYFKYQAVKIFYLVSENFFNTVDGNILIKSWKYFIGLYEYFEEKEKNINHNNSESNIKAKEEQVIMSICLRIMLENIKYRDFFKLKMKRDEDGNNPFENLILKTIEESLKININSSLIYELKSSGYWTEVKDYINKEKNKKKTKIKKHLSSKHLKIKSEIESNDKPKEKRNKSYSSKNDYSKKKPNLPINNNQINTIDNEDNKKKKKNKYLEYCSRHTLFSKLVKEGKINDYIFKAMILFILENNNKVNIQQNIKLDFILKAKKYEQLQNPDYKSFLCVKYFNEEISKEFRIMIKIIETNKNSLSSICFDILLYLLIQIIKEREKSRNICSLFVESDKICNRFFKSAFLYNKKSADLIIKEFPLFIKLLVPYYKKLFIAFVLYDSVLDIHIHNNYAEKLFNIFLTTKPGLENTNKSFYDFLINKLIILYIILKADKIYIDEKIDLEENGLLDLVNDNLIFIKYDVLYKNKKKCYIEILYEFFINLYIKSNNRKYYSVFNKIFIDRKESIKKKVKEAKTIIYYVDKASIKEDKKNPCYKFYSKNSKIENSLCISLLLKTIKYWGKYINESKDIKIFLQDLILYLFEDSKLIYKENKIFQKKDKTNTDYNLLLDNIKEIVVNKKNIKIEDIIKKLNVETKNKDIKDDKKSKNINESNDTSISLNLSNANDLDYNQTNTSSSEIDIETECIINPNKSNKNKDEKNNNTHKYNNNINNNPNNNITTPDDYLIRIRQLIFENKNQYTLIRDNLKNKNNNYSDEYLDIDDLKTRDRVIIFPKNTLLEQRFSLYFADIFFYNKLFVLMKNYFKYYIKNISGIEIDLSNYFNYPTIIKNYTPKNLFFGGFFLKNDTNFFDNKLTRISHKYFIQKMEKFKIKNITIFPKKTEQDDIHNLLIESQIDDNYTFYVDLVTNRNAVFGQLIVSKNMIYFENLSKDEFLKNKTESAKEQWLLCSLDCDYSNRVKKIYIFKTEIREIINRRFLYLFQACEICLNNGKSYYFNFYSEEKKIKFFSLFNNENNIDIIYDLKTSFKKKNYTKQWISNELSTLEYLLFLNKFSCRSYNDINQYPVFPWLELYQGKTRDLKYTVAAQTEDERMIKREMYLASSEKFPYHYTTHFSNSAYLAYYLIRTNPFTNNQINLQVNKFDNPSRQFNAIDEILSILKHTSQPREIIPEFFLSTEFYYNYNCNFYGITDDGNLINNLYNKEGFNSPLEYILHNLLLLETPQVKNEINYFFDSIYGVGQMGGIDAFNTYNKYSYQEMFDLKQKIDKYKQQKLGYNKIKEKIILKCNKIISFGQTPFKILEDKHPQWMPKKEVNEIPSSNLNNNLITTERVSLNNMIPNNSVYDEDKTIIGIKITHKIFFDIYSYIHKDNLKQCIVVLNKFSKNKFELKFYDLKFKELSFIKSLSITKEIKFFSKLRIFGNKFLYAYQYDPTKIMINFRLSIFVFCHFNDNSFKVFTSKGDNYSIMTESMVTCLAKISDIYFATGHFNGKIIVWEIPNSNEKSLSLNDFNKIKIKSNFIAHQNKVNNIVYFDKIDVIISSGDDKKIFIRKFFDLSLLTMIEINNKICIDIKVEHYYLYTILFDEIKQKYIIEILSFNGKIVGKSEYDFINNISFDKNGNLLIGYYKKDIIDVYDPSLTNKIGEINLNINEQSKILTSDKKNNAKLNENISIGDDILLTSFSYNKSNNSIYYSLSNGLLLCQNLNSNN